jgi:hypothetical protein
MIHRLWHVIYYFIFLRYNVKIKTEVEYLMNINPMLLSIG